MGQQKTSRNRLTFFRLVHDGIIYMDSRAIYVAIKNSKLNNSDPFKTILKYVAEFWESRKA
jgi:hypothetical protein